MAPTRAWKEPPARHGFATDRERAAWQAGHDLADRLGNWELAHCLAELCPAGTLSPEAQGALATLPPAVWSYAFLAGMASAVADGLR